MTRLLSAHGVIAADTRLKFVYSGVNSRGFAFLGNGSRLVSPAFMADSTLRADGRAPNQLRPLRFQNHIAPYAAGSTLVEWGNTRVICGVTIEDSIPRWMKEQGVKGGWITAEYSMLPYSTLQRKQRDSTKGKIDGRSRKSSGSSAGPCAPRSTSTNSANARSGWIATCCRPMAARAPRPSPAPSSRCRSR